MAEDTQGIDFIAKFFRGKTDGYLIDVGAHDGVEVGSMSRALVRRGWGGLMVEPLPEAYKKLASAYKDNPKVECFRVACSNYAGKAMLHPCRGVSTLNPEWAKACSDWWKHVNYGDPIKVDVYPLRALLEMASAPARIDFLQIDTEGHDLYVLQGMDWKRGPSLICVEVLDMLHRERKMAGKWHPSPELSGYLRSKGYHLAKLTKGGNAIYLREDAQ